ncbi:MAG: alpha/beta hydrolase [Candidatus Viridilinea halotolerans]|uniref:Alpha/beta hydrolase n=1 Tax=Candidatus Viridilinea halotolerans TaxID=2491704 RepID=A0A426TQQ4_9CHLR|nr:MAG: alpha/beta hydrolase [Candidatus Viridilinea halotolerans]
MINHFHHAGHTLTWEEHSAGAQTIIFIHGYSANRAIWSHELELLGHAGRCVTLDLPGHYPALMAPSCRSLSQEDLFDLELRAIQAIAGDGPCTLVGHSTGGMIALAAAARMPTLVERVVALAPVVWGPLTGALGFYQRLLPLPGSYFLYWLHYRLTQLSLRFIQWGIATAYSGNMSAYLRNPVAAEAVRRWHPIYAQSRLRNLATMLLTLRHCDIRSEVTKIQCPVLLISGERDPVVPVAQARWLSQQLVHGTSHILPGVGHLPQWEAADGVHARVSDWLA